MTTTHAFFLLNRSEQQLINQEVQILCKEQEIVDKLDYKASCKEAFSVMSGEKKDKPTQLAQQILNNFESVIKTRSNALPIVDAWKKNLRNIGDITSYLQGVANVSLGSAVLPVGVACLYFRSHKVFALASASAACALFVIRSICCNLRDAFKEHANSIEVLSLQNVDQLSKKVNDTYHKLKKTSFIVRWYLETQEQYINSEHKGLELLADQLAAFEKMNEVFNPWMIAINLFFGSPPTSTPSYSIPANKFLEIVKFFTRFESLCFKGLLGTIGIGMIALGESYYAYVQRARLMVLAGVVYLLGSVVFSREFYVLKNGSKNIRLSENCVAMNKTFQEMAKQSFLLRMLGLKYADNSEIYDVFVISFNEILKLIPSWKKQNFDSTASK